MYVKCQGSIICCAQPSWCLLLSFEYDSSDKEMWCKDNWTKNISATKTWSLQISGARGFTEYEKLRLGKKLAKPSASKGQPGQNVEQLWLSEIVSGNQDLERGQPARRGQLIPRMLRGFTCLGLWSNPASDSNLSPYWKWEQIFSSNTTGTEQEQGSQFQQRSWNRAH